MRVSYPVGRYALGLGPLVRQVQATATGVETRVATRVASRPPLRISTTDGKSAELMPDEQEATRPGTLHQGEQNVTFDATPHD